MLHRLCYKSILWCFTLLTSYLFPNNICMVNYSFWSRFYTKVVYKKVILKIYQMFYRTYGSHEAINKTYTLCNDTHSSRLVGIDLNYWTPAQSSRALDPLSGTTSILIISVWCLSVQPLILTTVITSPISFRSKWPPLGLLQRSLSSRNYTERNH